VTSVALLSALVGTGVAIAAAAPAHASRESVAAAYDRPPGLQGFLPLAEVGKPYSGEVLMRFDTGRIVSVTIDNAKLPPGITAVVNPDNTIRVSGTPTQARHFELVVSMTGLTTNGEIITGSSSRELIISTAVRIDSPGPVHQGLPVSEQLPMTYSSGNVIDVTATGLPDGLSISPTGLITGTTLRSRHLPRHLHRQGFPLQHPAVPLPHLDDGRYRHDRYAVGRRDPGVDHDARLLPPVLQLAAADPARQWRDGQLTATGLPEGLSVSPTGLVSGYPRHDVHHPVTFTVTARPVGAPWVIEKSVSLPLTIWYHS
jgi:hypothetical protein